MIDVLNDLIIAPLSNFSNDVVSGNLDSIDVTFFWIFGALIVVGAIDIVKRCFDW